MALSVIDGISVAGIVSCVPPNKIDNLTADVLGSAEDAERFVKNTGIRFKRIVASEVCTSDLSEKAANKLLEGLNWDKDEISVIIVVTQTPDYLVPNTAILLQNRLSLKKTCLAFDIPLGCSGYVYGLSVMASILKSNNFKKGLLLVGDTLSKQASPYDKSAYPLFGDAATATAIENTGNPEHKIKFLLGSDGEGYESIIVRII
jgi:3-oxoacyl-[acyl-carrier-protein] synthase-3